MSESLGQRLEGVGWKIGWRLARALPERTVRRAFERMSMRSHRRNARQRAIVEDNLRPIVGEERLDAVVADAFRWYGRYWSETFRMQDLSDEELEARFSCDGCEIVDELYAKGDGVVVAVPHLGNWDSGGRWAGNRWPLAVVVEVLKPRAVFEAFLEHRRALGMTIIPLERNGDVTARCMEQLQKGNVLALVADRDLSRSAVEVGMFGRRTKLPPGPAVLALRTGAPLVPATIYQREDGTWHARVLPPLPKPDADAPEAVETLTQRLADAFAVLIAEAPEQWHMFSRYWVDG